MRSVALYGVEAAGAGIWHRQNAAQRWHYTVIVPIVEDNGQIIETHSISAGLDCRA